MRRISTSTSTSDPITGVSTSSGFSYAPLTEQDRIEMRLGFIINGDKNSNSVGIKNASQEALEDEEEGLEDEHDDLHDQEDEVEQEESELDAEQDDLEDEEDEMKKGR